MLYTYTTSVSLFANLYNVCEPAQGLVVLVFVGAVFIIRYMRTEKKSAKRK